MKDKVISLLIKRGWNPEDAARITERELPHALRMFPEARAAKLAEVVACL